MKQIQKFILTINTTLFEKAEVGLKSAEGQILENKKFTAERNLSGKLLPEIDKLLKQKNTTIKDLTAIEVNTGPGSFTGTRIGVAVANALAFSLSIPVNGKEMVTPIYSKPPNATLPPKSI